MLSIRSSSELDHTLDGPISPSLSALLRRRSTELSGYDGYDLADLAFFLVVQAGDELGAVDRKLGFRVLSNFIDGSSFGEADFTPSWEWVQAHPGWFEIVFILSDDGFGWIVLVEDGEGTDPALLSACRTFALPID